MPNCSMARGWHLRRRARWLLCRAKRERLHRRAARHPSAIPVGSSRGGKSEKGGSGRTNESVDRIPDRVEVGDFVRKKFDEIKGYRDAQHPGMRKNLQSGRQMEHPEALEKTQRRDSGVKIEAGRKSGAEREAERFDRIHAGTS